MKLFEGKTPTERNKIIAALVLGALALLALTYTFGGMFFGGSKKTVTVAVASPTPTAAPRADSNLEPVRMPTKEEQNFGYTTTPIRYNPGAFYAPDAGRNIFAFYEPPPPTPYSPTPPPTPKMEIIPTPSPTPVPPLLVGYVTPQSVYAGSKTFRLEVNGDKFTPDSLIFLNGNQLPTTFVSPQKLVADVPSNFITGAGALQIMVRTADGALYSNQVSIGVQAPPVPQFQYIGMIARQKYNNDTAYFLEPNKPTPFGARLNDIVAGRFRLTSISSGETIFEDVNLGFKHRLALLRPQAGQNGANPNQTQNGNDVLGSPGRYQNKGNPNSPNFNPNVGQPQIQTGDCPPGIPCNTVPIYVPPPPQPKIPDKDEDDDGDN